VTPKDSGTRTTVVTLYLSISALAQVPRKGRGAGPPDDDDDDDDDDDEKSVCENRLSLQITEYSILLRRSP